MFIEKVSLNKLIKKFNTPLYCYSQKLINENIINFKRNFKSFAPLICYAVKANSNLRIVMEDYSKKECDNSVKVWKSDSEIDSLYSEILMDILNSIKTNPDATDALVPLLFIARYLERVGDQATNVAEETYFVVTGEDLEGLEKTEVENETTF